MISMVLTKVINEVWPMLTVFMVAIILVRLFYLKSHREKIVLYKECMYLFSILYCWLLFELLTTTEINSNSSINLVPFEEILRYSVGSDMFILNVFGNILIFLPFGFFISHYVKSKSVWPILITSTILSIVVETTQLNIGRSFDVDDIILNVVGSILGYLLYVVLKKIERHLPDFLKSSTFYNILWLVIIAVIAIYFLGYWKVIF